MSTCLGCPAALFKILIHVNFSLPEYQNYQFINPEGNSKLPYWGFDNYDTLFYFDDKLNFKVFNIGINTCVKNENYSIIYGKKQICEKNI